MMIRRELVERVGGWPEYGGVIEPKAKLADDGTLLQIILDLGRYTILDEVLAYHRTLRRLQPEATA